jgi:four helix bundle protein
MQTHRDLDVWKLSMQLTADIYRLTESFPRDELYGLKSQLRRAAVSIVSNIAEGAARQTKKEYVQFLYCSLGSSAELETQLELSKMLKYVTEDDLNPLFEMQNRIARMLSGLIRKWKNKPPERG